MGQSSLELGLFGRETIQEEGLELVQEHHLELEPVQEQGLHLGQEPVQEQGLHLGQEPVREQGLHLESFHCFHFQWWLWEPLWRSH